MRGWHLQLLFLVFESLDPLLGLPSRSLLQLEAELLALLRSDHHACKTTTTLLQQMSASRDVMQGNDRCLLPSGDRTCNEAFTRLQVGATSKAFMTICAALTSD